MPQVFICESFIGGLEEILFFLNFFI